jgi:hypothetical protein
MKRHPSLVRRALVTGSVTKPGTGPVGTAAATLQAVRSGARRAVSFASRNLVPGMAERAVPSGEGIWER